MAAGDDKLVVQLPAATFPEGKLHLRFVRLFFCDNATHAHHFDAVETTPYPPLAQDYHAEVTVRPPKAFRLDAAIGHRFGSVELNLRSPLLTSGFYLPNLPARRSPVFPPKLLASAPRPVAAPVAAAPAVGAAAPIPVAPAVDGYVSDDDPDDGSRLEPLLRARRDIVQLGPEDVRLTVGFGPPVGPAKLPADLATIDVRTKTLEELVGLLDACLAKWSQDLGGVFARRPRFAARDLSPEEIVHLLAPDQQASANEYALVVLSLPPGIGLALREPDHFSMFGLPTNSTGRVRQQDGWLEVPQGFRYLLGLSDDGSNSDYTGIRAVKRTATGLELATAEQFRKKAKYAAIAEKLVLLQPRLVHSPRKVSYAANLSRYPPKIAGLTGRYVHLHGLAAMLEKMAASILGLTTPLFIFVTSEVVDGDKMPDIIPVFDAAASHANLFMEVRFGSDELAASFGVADPVFRWTANPDNAEANYMTETLAAQYTREALTSLRDPVTGERKNDHVKLGDEAESLLRLNLGNVVPGSLFWRNNANVPKFLLDAKQAFANAQGAGRGAGPAPAPADLEPPHGDGPNPEEGIEPAGEEAEAAEPEPIFVLQPNPKPAPPREFVHFQRRDNSRCGANADFPDKFYLLSDDGERDDHFDDLGRVCVAGSFGSKGETEVGGSGFVLTHYSREPRRLVFHIYSWDLQLFKNAKGYDAFARCVLTATPFRQLPQ